MLAIMTTLSNFKLSSIPRQITPFKVPSSAETLLSGLSTCFLPRSSRGCSTVKPHCRAGNSCDQLHNLGYRRRVATAYAGHKTPYRFRGVKYINKHKMAHAKPPSAATAVPLETAKIGELENDWDDENEPSGMHAGKYFKYQWWTKNKFVDHRLCSTAASLCNLFRYETPGRFAIAHAYKFIRSLTQRYVGGLCHCLSS